MTPAELYYRKTAAASSSGGLGVLIGLYDTLAGDLRRMAEAERGDDLVRRCREANHALLVIGCLEDCVTKGSSGELADQLTAFYGSLRRNLVLAQAKRSPEMIEEQMAQGSSCAKPGRRSNCVRRRRRRNPRRQRRSSRPPRRNNRSPDGSAGLRNEADGLIGQRFAARGSKPGQATPTLAARLTPQ
jgi:flagellin-specific chaperone FliS